MKKIIITTLISFFSLYLFAQDTRTQRSNSSVKARKHANNHKYKKQQEITGINNTGSSDGTMPDNKSEGKVTTNPKGKNGPKNSNVKKPL